MIDNSCSGTQHLGHSRNDRLSWPDRFLLEIEPISLPQNLRITRQSLENVYFFDQSPAINTKRWEDRKMNLALLYMVQFQKNTIKLLSQFSSISKEITSSKFLTILCNISMISLWFSFTIASCSVHSSVTVFSQSIVFSQMQLTYNFRCPLSKRFSVGGHSGSIDMPGIFKATILETPADWVNISQFYFGFIVPNAVILDLRTPLLVNHW